MSTVTVGKENSTSIELYYEDHGSGQPVVLINRTLANTVFAGTDPVGRRIRIVTARRRGKVGLDGGRSVARGRRLHPVHRLPREQR